jgi:alkylation response protein AidB-like acyl-CoA dehydrogenase
MKRFGIPIAEEDMMIAKVARDFAERRLAPGAAERDRSARYPVEQIRELGKLGLLAMKVSSDDGGAGTSNIGYVLAMQAIAEACASTAVVLASSNLAAKILADHASPQQRSRWVSPYARGDIGPASFALTEPLGGSDAAAVRTRATFDGTHWILNGEKAWITSGAFASFHLVFARSDGEPGQKEGISCFVVEKNAPGLTVGKEEDKMGQRASGTAPLAFVDCKIPAENLVGKRGRGYGVALSALGAGRVGIAALSLGIAEAAFAKGVAYGSERKAFGRALTEFQNTQFVLADCRTELDAAWLLTLRAATLLDHGERAGAESSMAKLFASEACGRVVDRMVQLHGGYGYSREYDVERLYRDARVTRIYEGTNEIQRIVVAREISSGSYIAGHK